MFQSDGSATEKTQSTQEQLQCAGPVTVHDFEHRAAIGLADKMVLDHLSHNFITDPILDRLPTLRGQGR